MRTILKVETKPWYSNQERYEHTQSQLDPNYDSSQDDYVAVPNGAYSESPWSPDINAGVYVINPLFAKVSYPDDSDPSTYPSKYSIDNTNKIISIKIADDYRIQMDINLNCQFYGWAQNIKVEMIRRNESGDAVIDTFNPVTSIRSIDRTDNQVNVIVDSTHSFLVGDKIIFKLTSLTQTYQVTELDGAPFVVSEVVESDVNFRQVRISGNYTIQSV